MTLRMFSLIVIFTIGALVAGCGGGKEQTPSPPATFIPKTGADTVYLSGVILTMNAAEEIAEAVAVEGDTIRAVGTNEEIRAFIGENTRVVDLGGKAMLPGFIDAHSHMPWAGDRALYAVDCNSPPTGPVTSIADIIERLKERAAVTPKGEWVEGWGYDDTLLAEKRHLTRWDLDRVSTEHPIFLFHVSSHIAVVNSYVLEMRHITRNTKQPPGGEIEMDPETGEPTGVLKEFPAWLPIILMAVDRTPEENRAAIRYMSDFYASRGVTTAQTGSDDPPTVAKLLDAEASGDLRIRVNVSINASPGIDLLLAGQFDPKVDSKMVRVANMKLFADGSIQAYTAYLTEPYYVPPADDPAYGGYPSMTREKLADYVIKCRQAGMQVHIHANGDAAIDNILYAFEEAQKAYPSDDPRFVCIHCQTAREDQLDKMKEIGVIPSFFILHTYYWGDRHQGIFLGSERAARISPCRSAVDRGMPFTLHCDTPVVPMDPLFLVWSAVNRVTSGGEVLGPAQRIEPLEALKAVTIYAAYQGFEENIKGSIESGKLADLVILSENPLAVDPMWIKDIQVEETIVGGQTVYER